ncbi:ABC transporter substrate-binding protein [Rhodobacteraceae bacterium]|nr:ABC transporter substrate-binding protein [Paracoccaceae bacterium]
MARPWCCPIDPPPDTRNAPMIRRLAIMILLMLPVAATAQDFPRRIDHALGTTQVPARPTRIVTIGYHEQDFLYALGIAPVGVHEWFGARPYATWIWADQARQALGGRPCVQKGYEVDVEWVFLQKPDLIIASFYNLDPATYAQLSRIAPVIGAPDGYPAWGAPWQAELRLIAQATGREAKAEAVISGIEGQIRDLAQANPAFHGQSATIGYFAADHFVGYRRDGGGNELLAQLGLQTPEIFDGLVQANGQFSVSPERLDLFEADAVVWLVDAQTAAHIRAMPAYGLTRLAREGRSIWVDEDLQGALSFMTPLSIPYALERLTPLLRTALDGDPATR